MVFNMKIRYLSHSGFLIGDLVIDPYLTENEKSNVEVSDIDCNVILVTHDHFDHIGDSITLASDNDATIVGIYELTEDIMLKEDVKVEGMNIGGWLDIGDWKVKMVQAFHSSNLGTPVGFIGKHKSGFTFYHAGDTGLFYDMKIIGEEGIDVAFLPIGGRFTMGIDDAVKAAKLINPKIVVPMHYSTFPPIEADPKEFSEKCEKEGISCSIFEIGEEKEL